VHAFLEIRYRSIAIRFLNDYAALSSSARAPCRCRMRKFGISARERTSRRPKQRHVVRFVRMVMRPVRQWRNCAVRWLLVDAGREGKAASHGAARVGSRWRAFPARSPRKPHVNVWMTIVCRGPPEMTAEIVAEAALTAATRAGALQRARHGGISRMPPRVSARRAARIPYSTGRSDRVGKDDLATTSSP